MWPLIVCSSVPQESSQVIDNVLAQATRARLDIYFRNKGDASKQDRTIKRTSRRVYNCEDSSRKLPGAEGSSFTTDCCGCTRGPVWTSSACVSASSTIPHEKESPQILLKSARKAHQEFLFLPFMRMIARLMYYQTTWRYTIEYQTARNDTTVPPEKTHLTIPPPSPLFRPPSPVGSLPYEPMVEIK